MKVMPIGYALLLAVSTGLTGCAVRSTSLSAGLEVSCNSRTCKAKGDVRVGITFNSETDFMLAAVQVLDAAQLVLDTTGSTIPYPNSGTVTVSLIDSSTGVIQAAKLFGWTKFGNELRLTDPGAVNSWAVANAGSADEMSYELTQFQSNFGTGVQTIAATATYQNTAIASARSTFTSSCGAGPGGNPPNMPGLCPLN